MNNIPHIGVLVAGSFLLAMFLAWLWLHKADDREDVETRYERNLKEKRE